MCDIICIIQDITSSLFHLKPQFRWHHTHYIRHPSTVSVSSNQLYRWYHSHYMYDITSSICETFYPLYLWHRTHYVWHHKPLCWLHQLCISMTSFALQKTSHPVYHIKQQSLWLHIHFRHDITPPVSDITPTLSLSSQPLHWYHRFGMISHPVYA